MYAPNNLLQRNQKIFYQIWQFNKIRQKKTKLVLKDRKGCQRKDMLKLNKNEDSWTRNAKFKTIGDKNKNYQMCHLVI